MSIDRDAISRKITLGFYPVTNMIQPRFSWAFDPSVREPGYDPAAADRALRSRRLAARFRRHARDATASPLHLTYVQFPEIGDRRSRRDRRSGGVARARRRRHDQIGQQRAALSCRTPACSRPATFDLAYVPWTMGADPDDSSVLGCGAPSNYMRWCDPRVDALERAALARPSRDASANGSTRRSDASLRSKFRFSTSSTPITSTRIANGCAALRRTLSYPTWNAYRWSHSERAGVTRNFTG